MKSFIKIYLMPILFMLAISVQGFSQNRSNSSKGKTTKTTVSTKKSNYRVPSSKVTYKKNSHKVTSVRSIPNKTVINHNGENYYYSNNKFYAQSRGSFVVIPPKIGFRVRVLPNNYTKIRYNSRDYYNVNGTFYIEINNQYEVVEPEIGTIVYSLPEDYEKVVIDGLSYYEYGNILYEKIQVDGTRAYEVVGIIDIE
ncbi:hypothetical protein FNB79_04975 [Formosa sediminum]|uniref:Uncharacterized protein n=1 Tax=Formosa sediminum TaxID=2594004 RepID=A0A516GP99_9FLAO|nr:DUF6515 family protein [Formosa sediminum]QDO93352.1 hypothetical protein FNB79_04975 [Formosa sediminum]